MPAGLQYQSAVATRGSYVDISGVWTIGNIAAAGVPSAGTPANGDTVSLTIKAKVLSEGVTFNTAEISKVNEKEDEDYIDRVCVTVPLKLCLGQGVEVTIQSTYSGIVWKDSQGVVVPSNGNNVTFTKAGSYTFTATNGNCPASGCCPVIVEEINCCPAEVCVPFTITERKK